MDMTPAFSRDTEGAVLWTDRPSGVIANGNAPRPESGGVSFRSSVGILPDGLVDLSRARRSVFLKAASRVVEHPGRQNHGVARLVDADVFFARRLAEATFFFGAAARFTLDRLGAAERDALVVRPVRRTMIL